ncbi:uncharacterized protein LOC113377292 [Ctenocephalides felis]|uniref:uncharacterized protein LOC113377292 n=1 Tax=Ctenocephalides felis TaxID=7515 RepID=UPI000E6E51CE|nr:uncharacterized protein LOC113377292 [Ctenocephalides felis]
MGNDRLYSVKWYKDEEEFFRYAPAQSPSTLTFPVTGVRVRRPLDLCDDSQCSVTLQRLDATTKGSYRCEVSTEAPTFHIAHKAANMSIAILPRRDPIIHGLAEHYSVGDMVIANCTADKSDPPARVTWFINDEQAHPSLVSTAISQTYAFGGVSSRSVSLHLQADRRLFRGPHAELTVRCLAVVPSQPARQASVTVSLRPSHQQLRNQKLEWPNSADSQHNSALLRIPIVVASIFFTSCIRHLL